MSDMVTIREAVSRTKEDGIPISEYTLRQWVRTGAIPSRKAGTKTLLFYPNLVTYLRCEDGGNAKPMMTEAIEGSLGRIGGKAIACHNSYRK